MMIIIIIMMRASLSRDEDDREEDVIDAMLNRGRGTGKFEGPRLGMHQLYCKIGRALTKYFGVVPFQVLYSLSCLLLGVQQDIYVHNTIYLCQLVGQ